MKDLLLPLHEPTPEPHSRPRAVVCLSGGMDSTVCASLAARDFDTFGLHISYGQRTEARELAAAQAVAQAVGFQDLLHLKTDLFRRIGGSALTDPSIPVPVAPESWSSTPYSLLPTPSVPVTYVPFRNANFLAAAVSYAETLHAQTIFLGAVEQDSSGYPDCRPAFYTAFNELIRQGTKAAAEGGPHSAITVTTPLIHLHKRDIVRLGVELGAPLHVSWSCYSAETEACGVCESCILRLRAFAEAGTTDPIPYATTS